MGGASVPAGRILGIPVRLHWTVFLLLPAAGTILGAGLFRDWYPGRSAATYAGMAAAATALLVVSILLHELGHAAAARRRGIRVDGVTLWALGGLTRFGGPAHGPRDELRVAAAGPLVTMWIAVVAGAVSRLLAPAPPAQGVAAWLAAANALLLVFNLLPGFPLDGGRIMRAAIWARSGDHARATRLAAVTGRAVGAGLGGLAALLIVVGDGWDGIWLALVAWFLIGAAAAEEGLAAAERALGDLTAAAVMRRTPGAVAPDEPLTAALATGAPAVPVVADGRLWGLVVPGDAAVEESGRGDVRVRDVARPRGAFVELAPGDPVGQALEGLAAEPRVAVVVDAGRPVGILTLQDVDRRLHPAPAHHAPPPRRRGPITPRVRPPGDRRRRETPRAVGVPHRAIRGTGPGRPAWAVAGSTRRGGSRRRGAGRTG